MPKLFIASDHGGFKLKDAIKKELATRPALVVTDLGCQGESVDYPDYAVAVARNVSSDPDALGILICGTGNGMCMAANKVKGIRAALVFSAFTGEMARGHNHANIICLGERTTAEPDALAAVKAWLDAAPEGDRHARRVAKLDAIA